MTHKTAGLPGFAVVGLAIRPASRLSNPYRLADNQRIEPPGNDGGAGNGTASMPVRDFGRNSGFSGIGLGATVSREMPASRKLAPDQRIGGDWRPDSHCKMPCRPGFEPSLGFSRADHGNLDVVAYGKQRKTGVNDFTWISSFREIELGIGIDGPRRSRRL